MTQQNGTFAPGYGGMKFGDNFWPGAKPSPQSMVERLLDGYSVSVFGLRRLGKSSLLAEARERLRSMGKNVIWVSLDAEDSLLKVLSTILASMNQDKEEKIVAGIRKWVESTDLFPADLRAGINALIAGRIDSASETYIDMYTEVIFREIGQQIGKQNSDDKPIIMFDELTLLLSNTIDRAESDNIKKTVARLNSFLGMLRNWRSDDFGIKMAVSGSVSMDWLQRNHGIRSDSINDCLPMWINEMDRSETKGLIEACVKAHPPMNWNDDCTEELLNMLPAYYPGTVQLAFGEIYTEDASLEMLRGPLKETVFDALWKEYFRQFELKFQGYSAAEKVRAAKLFDAIAGKKGTPIGNSEAQEILNNSNTDGSGIDSGMLLDCLISDSFLKLVPDGVKFTSGLVPAWH